MAANSESSTNVRKQEQPHDEDVSSEISGPTVVKSVPTYDSNKEVKRESMKKPIDTMDRKARNIEKFKKYQADYKQHLISKYFSGKTGPGGNLLDVLADPAGFLELVSKESTSSNESSTSSNSNEKPSA